MAPDDPFERLDQQRLRLFLYLIPLVGALPALVCLYRESSDSPPLPHQRARRQALQVSRQSVKLTLAWLVALALCNAGGQLGESSQVTVLLLSSVLTSGYFLTNVWLMVQLGRGKRPELPGLSALGERRP